jgi:hypothetical protein
MAREPSIIKFATGSRFGLPAPWQSAYAIAVRPKKDRARFWLRGQISQSPYSFLGYPTLDHGSPPHRVHRVYARIAPGRNTVIDYIDFENSEQ